MVGKTVGSAVVRNRVRRRLRHIVRDQLPRLATRPSTDIVIRALPAAATATSAELAADVDAAFARVVRS